MRRNVVSLRRRQRPPPLTMISSCRDSSDGFTFLLQQRTPPARR
jgi:hypothetical protein